MSVAAESARQEASAFLTRVLDPQLQSLAASALGSADKPDLSFISAADSGCKGITGYNMQEVSSFCLEQALKLGGRTELVELVYYKIAQTRAVSGVCYRDSYC